MFVEQLKDNSEWIEFLQASQAGTFYHTLKWKDVIEKSFGHSAIYSVAKDINGAVVGICPGFVVGTGPLRTYVSIPHSDFGGPVIDKNYIPKASLSLSIFLRKVCSDNGIAYAKLRFLNDRIARFYKSPSGYVDKSLGIMEIDLQTTPLDFIWSKVLDRARRKKIRRFEGDGFQVREACGESDLAEFYDSYFINMRYIGAKEPSYTFFENIWRVLYPENFNVLLVEKEKTVGGLAFFKHRQRIYLSYLGMNRELLSPRYSLGLYLHWKGIEWASENGFRYVCLGSTPSDANSAYYSQKMALGCSFYQQEIVWYPTTFAGRIFLQTRTSAVPYWRAFKSRLPHNLKDFLENRLLRF